MTEKPEDGPVKGPIKVIVQELPLDQLTEGLQDLGAALAERALSSVTDKVEGLTGRLTDYVDGDGSGLVSALTGGAGLAGALKGGGGLVDALKGGSGLVSQLSGSEGLMGRVKGVAKLAKGFTGLKSALGGQDGKGGKGGKGRKVKLINIVEIARRRCPETDRLQPVDPVPGLPELHEEGRQRRPAVRREGHVEGAGLLVAPDLGVDDHRAGAGPADHLAVQGSQGLRRRCGDLPRAGPRPHPGPARAGVPPAGAVRAHRQPLAGPGTAGPPGVQALPASCHVARHPAPR